MMKIRSIVATSMLVWGTALAEAAPLPKENIPGNQLIYFQPQADSLAVRLAAIIQSAESAGARLPSAAKEASIQSALQDAIMASGDYPRVVLSALEAFSLCPTTPGRFAATQVPVSCENLRQPLSAEAREALASLQKVIIALVDQNDSPSALGISGNPPFQDNDGGSGHRGGGGNSDDAPGARNFSSIEANTGPGGGGSSGYNTN